MRYILLVTPLLFALTSCSIVKGIKDSSKSNKAEVQAAVTGTHTLPFELENNKIIVKVNITHDGTEHIATLMLDTGAPTLLSEDFAKRNHLSLSDSSTIHISTPVAGEQKIKKYAGKDFWYNIAGISVLKPHLRIMAISNSVAECNNIDGILGVDILSKFNLAFDFKEKKITIYNKETLPDDISAYTHVLKFDNYSLLQKTPSVTLKVNSTEEDYIWDTGFNGALYMRNNSEKSFGKWTKAHPEAKRYETLGAVADISGKSANISTSYVFMTDSIWFKNDLVSTHKLKASNQLNTKLNIGRNNVGIAFMKNYRMVISWSNKKIYLQDVVKPTPAFKLTPILAGYEPASKTAVIRIIAEDSKAYASGIRTNDQLVAIDDKQVADILKNEDKCTIDATLGNLVQKAKQLQVIHAGKQQTIAVE